MGDSETYRRRARECAALAADSESEHQQAIWRELEQHWLRLAQALELYRRVDPFTAFMITDADRSSAL